MRIRFDLFRLDRSINRIMGKLTLITSFLIVLTVTGSTLGQDQINLLSGRIQNNGFPTGWTQSGQNYNHRLTYRRSTGFFFERTFADGKCSFRYQRAVPNGDYQLTTQFTQDGNGPNVVMNGEPLARSMPIKITDGKLDITIRVEGEGKVWGTIKSMSLVKVRTMRMPPIVSSSFAPVGFVSGPNDTEMTESQTQCPAITPINTRLRYGNAKSGPLVKAWKFGDIATIVRTPGVHVNPDGNARAYMVGNRGLVDIQNGVKIKVGNTFMTFATYNKKFNKSFVPLWLDAERRGFVTGTHVFDAFALASIPFSPSSRSESSHVGGGRGKPVTQIVDGIKYYVSTTSVTQTCEGVSQDCYLDSATISAFVIPSLPDPPATVDPLKERVRLRQIGWAYYPSTRRSTFAVAGDLGPVANFGEATIAFQQFLRFGRTISIPPYRPNADYVTCPTGSSPENWNGCLFPGFEQYEKGPRIKAQALGGPMIFVLFDKDDRIMDGVITQQIINSRGSQAMTRAGGEAFVRRCLRSVPELANLL